MSNINITVINRIATYEGPSLVGENEKYKLTFTFDEEWEGITKIARFIWNRKFHDVPLNEYNQCEMPPFPSNAKLSIGVYSDTGLTSSAVEMPIRNSIKDGAIVPHPVVEVEVPPKWKLVERINILEEIDWDLGIETPIWNGEEESEEMWYDMAIYDCRYNRHLNGLYRFVFHTPIGISGAPVEESPSDSFWVAQSMYAYWDFSTDIQNQIGSNNWEPDSNGQYSKYIGVTCGIMNGDDPQEETEIYPFIELFLRPHYNEDGEQYYDYPTECWLEIYVMEEVDL